MAGENVQVRLADLRQWVDRTWPGEQNEPLLWLQYEDHIGAIFGPTSNGSYTLAHHEEGGGSLSDLGNLGDQNGTDIGESAWLVAGPARKKGGTTALRVDAGSVVAMTERDGVWLAAIEIAPGGSEVWIGDDASAPLYGKFPSRPIKAGSYSNLDLP